MNNSIMSSKNAIVKNIIDAEPVLFGSGATNAQMVKFAYGTLDKAAKATTDGQIAFGYDATTKAGAIYVGGNLVTSKILDITKANTEKVANVSTGVAETITVKYVDGDGVVQSTDFAVVDQKLVQELVAAQAAADGARLDALETWAKATDITAADGAVTVTPSEATDDFNTYTVGVNVDGVTVIKNATSSVLEAGKTLAIQDGSTLTGVTGVQTGHKYITLTAANGSKVESAIDLCDIVGESLIESTSYDPSTGELTLNWKTADGSDKSNTTVIDLGAMLDINDMSVVADSQKYLTVNLTGGENSQAVFTVHTQDVSTADADHMGLADAKQVKDYVDSKVASVNAEGDEYVSATYDDATSKITVATNQKDVEGTKGSVGVYDAEGAQTTAPTHGSLDASANTLMDGAQAIGKIKDYVDGEVAIEAARADAKVLAAVKALDAEVTSTDGTNIQVKVTEVDGKVTGVSVATEQYAHVYKQDTTSTVETPATNAALNINDGDEGKLVVASDLSTVAAHAADLVKQEADRAQKQIANLAGEQTDADAGVSVKVTTSAGQVSAVDVVVTEAVVTSDGAEGARTLTVDDTSAVLTGAAVSEFKEYVDNKVADFRSAADSTATVTDTHITATIAMVDGGLDSNTSSISYTKASYNAETNEITDGLASGTFVGSVVSDRINDLDATVSDSSSNVNVTIVEANGLLDSVAVTVDYATVTKADATKDASNNITAAPTLTVSNDSQVATGAMVKTAAQYAAAYTDAALTWTIL